MIKKIPIAELRPGMYLHDVNCSWRVQPIFALRFMVADERQIEEVRELGVREVYVDTSLGGDLPGAPTELEVKRSLEEEMIRLAGSGEIPIHHRLATRTDLEMALTVHNSARGLIQAIMTDVRLGKQVEFDSITEALKHVTDTMLGSFGSLIQLAHLKSADDYTFQHSVDVCALLTVFGKVLGLNKQTISDMAIGGLLHDVGKMRVPQEILNKPGRLTEAEFDEVKLHVAHGRDIISGAPWLSGTALNIIEHHHERYDGTGYPARLRASEISVFGQMAAIVDVYDAITSDRIYHKAMMPVEALRKLQEWSRYHFNEDLVAHFIRSLGIYPVRTVVRIESGRLGIVIEQNPANLVRPIVLVVYDTVKGAKVAPYRLDLEKSPNDRILDYVEPGKYGLDVDRCLRVT